MKVFLPVADNSGIASKLDSRFGRAAYFTIYDTETRQAQPLGENQYKNMDHGVGLKVAALAVENGCAAAVGAQPGPKAVDILEKGNVKMLVAYDCTVEEAIHRYRAEF